MYWFIAYIITCYVLGLWFIQASKAAERNPILWGITFILAPITVPFLLLLFLLGFFGYLIGCALAVQKPSYDGFLKAIGD